MKGKKFDAAEKHFIKKQERYESQIRVLREVSVACQEENLSLRNKVIELEATNQQQAQWIERLLEYTELSPADIKLACEKDKRLADMFGVVKRLSLFGSY